MSANSAHAVDTPARRGSGAVGGRDGDQPDDSGEREGDERDEDAEPQGRDRGAIEVVGGSLVSMARVFARLRTTPANEERTSARTGEPVGSCRTQGARLRSLGGNPLGRPTRRRFHMQKRRSVRCSGWKGRPTSSRTATSWTSASTSDRVSREVATAKSRRGSSPCSR